MRRTRRGRAANSNRPKRKAQAQTTMTHQTSEDMLNVDQELNDAHTRYTRGLGTLNYLPPELRAMVFASAIEAGSVALTATSKAINLETSPLLFAHGIYRTNIAFEGRLSPQPIRQAFYPTRWTNVHAIQNLEIRFNSTILADYVDVTLPNYLSSVFSATTPRVNRKLCRVFFDYNWYDRQWVCPGLLNAVAEFTGFKEIVVVITALKVGGKLNGRKQGLLASNRARAKGWVEQILVPNFGPVIWRVEEGEMRAYFHPGA